MMASPGRRGAGGSFASRRGHSSQLSISDPSHHVTEAIGTMYGDDDEDSTTESSRPLSFIATPYGGQEQMSKGSRERELHDDPRRLLVRSSSDKSPITLPNTANGGHPSAGIKKSQTLPARIPSQRGGFEAPKSPMSPLSPSPSLRDVQADSAGSQFPLTNIDNPNDIAQELSNLQALRRMSMDVGNTTDPDLLPFQGMSLVAMPSIAPTGDDDEADPSRLLWVPARVHPELDTTAFKDFLEKRVQTMKRRSGDSLLSADGLEGSSLGSLRRKKSMLSRQMATSNESLAEGYVDGAERLERKQSQSGQSVPELSLDELVKDPTKAVQKLARDTQRMEGGAEADADDMPILPAAPGTGLRRSTRTTYRKGGSLRSGDRLPFSKRLAARNAAQEGDDEPLPTMPGDHPRGHGLTRVQSEPVTENYSRPTRPVRRQQNFSRDSAPVGLSSLAGNVMDQDDSFDAAPASIPQDHLPVRTLSSHSSGPFAIPQIIETPPTEDTSQREYTPSPRPFPQRSSSQNSGAQAHNAAPEPEEPPARSSKRPSLGTPLQTSPPSTANMMEQPPASAPGQTLSDIVQNPSPLPGSGSTRTDSLTFIPTFTAEEKRRAKEKEEADNRPSAWKWFKSDEKDKKKKEKEREREREREREEQSKKSKSKSFAEKAHDAARLDVLQTSIDTAVAKGRESLLLDRESIDNKLHEERRKESNRKSAEPKKEKDSFFGSIFSSSKRKGEKETGKKHGALSPESPVRLLRPDVDFAWTRFTIIEERAIYRMAHIKLANPRRPLLSQVLLSNFMYSYLAKVQAMHPQLQVPVSPQQKRLDEERRRREMEEQQQQQQQLHQQDMGQDSVEQYGYDYHRAVAQYGDANASHDDPGAGHYVDDAQIYEFDHGGHGDPGDDLAMSSASHDAGGYHHLDGYGQIAQGQGGQDQYFYAEEHGRHHEGEDDVDMW